VAVSVVRYLAFGVAFCGSVVLGAGGCQLDATDGCGCPDTPSRPPRQAPISGLKVSGADGVSQAPIQPEGGSIEVTGSEVIVRYGQDSILHEVRYRVLGP
jgi:hypothetical protein